MRKLLPLVLALIGLGGGLGLGIALRPDPEGQAAPGPCGEVPQDGQTEAGADMGDADGEETSEGETTKEYVKLNNQFIVPVVEQGSVHSLVILSISLEVGIGQSEKAFQIEPKLRDSFLQVLFDHANSGGFEGAYTNANNMEVLRTALFETARGIMGKTVSDVLIVDIVRQDN